MRRAMLVVETDRDSSHYHGAEEMLEVGNGVLLGPKGWLLRGSGDHIMGRLK